MRSLTSTRLITFCLAASVALALPASAMADGKEVIRDCAQDGDLDKSYSDKELEDAYNNLPSDVDEYSNCRDVIRQAQAGGRGNSGGKDGGSSQTGGSGSSGGNGGGSNGGTAADASGDGSGGTASDAQELQNRTDAAQASSAPEAGSGSDSGGDSGLPTAVLVAIILLVLAGILGVLYMLRDRLPEGLTSRIPGLGSGQGR